MADYINRELLLNDLETSIVVSGRNDVAPLELRGVHKVINRIKKQCHQKMLFLWLGVRSVSIVEKTLIPHIAITILDNLINSMLKKTIIAVMVKGMLTMADTEIIFAWIKLIFSIGLIVGVPVFIGIINANYEGGKNE